LLRLDLRFEVLRDFALGLVMVTAGDLSVHLDGPPGRGVGGAGARKGAGFRLAPQPFVRRSGAGRRCQRRGPGPLGPGAGLRRRRQLGQGWQRATGYPAYRGYPFIAAGAAR